MNKFLTYTCGLGLLLSANISAQTRVTTSEATELSNITNGSVISIHDPSVVMHDGMFTIWGSHRGVAQSTDLINWTPINGNDNKFVRLQNQGDATGTPCDFNTAFNTQQVTKVKNYKGELVDMPNFDAEAYGARYAADKTTWIGGNMWAPDIIFNKEMQKWCMYLSVNGDHWSSIIILLTAPSPTGPFTYQGPVVMGGFHSTSFDGVATPKINETDYTIATGETSFHSRYKQSDIGKFWPNCIDPCVFYDENGELWMTYGSWSGGIFILKLDKETGLRDYTYKYTSDYSSNGASGTSDPYFGKKIAGGYYVSGEGSYVQHIGNYYYLFMSYGFFAPDGGYEMRIFRSTKPYGPYVDASGTNAVYTSYQMNYGPRAATNRGQLLMASYNNWGKLQNVGERAQGHNSACVDDKGRAFVVYHTKFNDGTTGHQVRVHQLFINDKGWPVVAPFCYQGEETTDATIAEPCPWTTEEIAGEYSFMMMPYKQDYEKFSEVTPSTIKLEMNGNVSGSVTGKWELVNGTSKIKLTLAGKIYYGVLCEQHINGATKQNYKKTGLRALAFTAATATTTVSANGVPVWGYKLMPESAIAWNLASNTIGVTESQKVNKNLKLHFETTDDTSLSWESSDPDIISETGKYNPAGLTDDKEMTLTGNLTCGNYFWEETYNVTAKAESFPSGNYKTGMVAYYDFNETPVKNKYNTDQELTLRTQGGGAIVPTFESDYDRDGNFMHQYFGVQKSTSHSRIPNPLYGATGLEGITISMWLKRLDTNVWDAIWGFFSGENATDEGARIFFTGNSYLGYNDNAGNFVDINHPNDGTYENIPADGNWHLVTIVINSTTNIRYALYVDGISKTPKTIVENGSSVAIRKLSSGDIINKVTELKYLYFGMGSFWGSAPVCIDDVIIYNRALNSTDVSALNTMSNRVYDFGPATSIKSIEELQTSDSNIFDLSGRRINAKPQSGFYIQGGKKYFVK